MPFGARVAILKRYFVLFAAKDGAAAKSHANKTAVKAVMMFRPCCFMGTPRFVILKPMERTESGKEAKRRQTIHLLY
jgi:hypothetical protein